MRRAIVPIVVVALVAGLIVYEVASGGSGASGKPAPPLPTSVLQAPKATLATLHGKPALINFWASWCEPCRAEAPELERFERGLHGSAQLVGVDYTDQSGPARDFIHKYGWTFPVLSDPDGIYGARFALKGLPTTVVLNGTGEVAEVLTGPQTAAALRQALASVPN